MEAHYNPHCDVVGGGGSLHCWSLVCSRLLQHFSMGLVDALGIFLNAVWAIWVEEE